MNTCGFCACEIKNNFCDFCKMTLDDKHIMTDGKRFNQEENFLGYPNRYGVHKSTPELMDLETIDLLCLLREARAFRSEVYQLRLLRHKAEEQTGMNDDVKEIAETTYSEYENATRKVWVIENIIKNRLGYFPQKVTQNFLNMYLDRMEKSEKKIMKMKK